MKSVPVVTNRGVSLIEVLLACALVAAIGGGVAALARPLRHALARADGSAQLEPAGRAAIEAMLRDVREGNADAAVAAAGWRLSTLMPLVFPLPDLAALLPARRGSAIRIRRVLSDGPQGILIADAAVGATVLLLDTAARCWGGAPACGFSAGDAAVIYTDAAAEAVTVLTVGPATLTLTRRLANAMPAGSVIASLNTTTYGIRTQMDGSRQLVRISSGGSEQPVLDNVTDLEIEADSADPARTELVSVRVRIEAPSPLLRGPAGYLFRRSGLADNARQWLPDAQLRFTVALRSHPGAP